MMLTFRDESYWPVARYAWWTNDSVLTTMQCPNCQSQLSPSAKQCDRCGEEIPAGQHLLEESGVVEPAPAAEPKSAGSARAGSNGQYRFASLGDRFMAFAVDSVLLFGLFAIVDAWAFMRWGTVEGAELQLTTAALLMAFTLNTTRFFVYGW